MTDRFFHLRLRHELSEEKMMNHLKYAHLRRRLPQRVPDLQSMYKLIVASWQIYNFKKKRIFFYLD